MPRLRKILTEFAEKPQPQGEAKPEVEIKVFEESENHKTYLVKLDKHFGFSITTFKEEKDASLVREETKVVFIAVDVTGSMGGIINDISKQISTILKLSSTLLPVKIILALYSDFEDNPKDDIIAASLQFIHVSSEIEASKALLKYWNTHVNAFGGGDSPEMNLTLMATIIQYYSGILNTTYDNHCFEVIGTEVTCQGVVSDTVNCAIIQVSDAENRDPVAVPDVRCSTQAKLEVQCLNKFFSSCTKWSDVDRWYRQNNVPYISIHVGSIDFMANSRENFRVGPSCVLIFSQVEHQVSSRLGSFIVALITCLLGMTSLEIITLYEKDFLIPLLEDKHQFPQEYIREFGSNEKAEALKLTAVEILWFEKIGQVPEYSSGKVMLEQLGMEDETKKEYYYNLCMEVARSDYFSVMISNPVFAEIVTALKTTWNHKQLQEFTNGMSERLNMCSEEEKESYSRWRESCKTLGVSTAALITKLIITPIQEDEEFEIVRLKDETARDTKSSISDFNLQQPKCVEALYKFVKGLQVKKTTKDALKSELDQYTLSKDSGGIITFTPVIDVSALPESVIAEAESEKNETFNLNALGLRGILRLYNSKLYLMGTSLTAFAMMCVICARRGKKGSYQRVGEMGEKYLASLRQKGVNWLKDKYTPGKIKPEACGALYSMVMRPFWELHADEAKSNVRHNLLTVKCWRYMNIMAVMHLTVYNDVKLPVLQMKKTLQCRNFSVLPSMLVRVSDQIKARHCVVCKRCGNYNFRGATLMDVCIMCMYGEHLFFKCKTAREEKEEATDSKKLMLRNCIRESNTRANFNGEMYCKKCCSYDDCTGGGDDDEGLKKHTVSFLVCEKCCCTYALSNEKDLKRTAVCFVCIFVDTLRQKFQNGQKDLESFLGDLSNPTLMVIQMNIIMACEEGNARLTDQSTFWSWLKETMESRHQTSMGQQSNKQSENMLKKLCGMKMTGDQNLCGMKISGDREKDKVIESRDATQNPDVAVPIIPRLPRRQKKMTKARRRREYKGRQKTLPVKERMEYIDKRREKRKKRRDIIAEKQAQAKELMQSSAHEDLLRRVRDAFTRTCHKCRMSVVCSPESMWEGCLVCDGLVDPTTSSHFQQVNKPLSDVVPLQLLNSLVLNDVGVKLSADSWKDLKKVSSIGQFFRFVEIVSSDDAGENEGCENEAIDDVDDREKISQDNNEEAVVVDDDDKKKILPEKVHFCGSPFNYNFIYNHLMMLKNGLEGKDLSSKKINEMKGVCLVCGDTANYMYSLHKEGNCSGLICRLCATRYYWSMIKEAYSYSSAKTVSLWLSCMFCRQFSGNLRNIWVWIGAKHNITNAIEDITEEESTFFRGVLNALSEGMFDNLRHEFEDSPNVIYNVCHKCLQLKLVPENQVALPAACGAPQQPIPADVIRFVCEDCSSKMVMKTEMSADGCYPDNTIEAALYTLQRANISTDTAGPDSECVSSKEVVRHCPVCKHDIVKEGGCLVMNCPVQSCRGEFCFICGLQSDDDEPGNVYTHLSRIHNVNYFGDLSEQQDLPILNLELVQTASGSQYLYVFDIDKYYFDTVTLKLERR